MSISPVTMERLAAADVALEAAQTKLEETKDAKAQAKQTLVDREASFVQAVREARESRHDHEGLDEEQSEKIFRLDDDRQRAREIYETKDREHRRQSDLVKEITENMGAIVRAARKGETLFDQKGKKGGDPEAWKGVLLADLVGQIIASEFANHGILTVSDALAAWAGGKLRELLQGRLLRLGLVDAVTGAMRTWFIERAALDELPTTDPAAKGLRKKLMEEDAKRKDDDTPAETAEGAEQPKDAADSERGDWMLAPEGMRLPVDKDRKVKRVQRHTEAGTFSRQIKAFASRHKIDLAAADGIWFDTTWPALIAEGLMGDYVIDRDHARVYEQIGLMDERAMMTPRQLLEHLDDLAAEGFFEVLDTLVDTPTGDVSSLNGLSSWFIRDCLEAIITLTANHGSPEAYIGLNLVFRAKDDDGELLGDDFARDGSDLIAVARLYKQCPRLLELLNTPRSQWTPRIAVEARKQTRAKKTRSKKTSAKPTKKKAAAKKTTAKKRPAGTPTTPTPSWARGKKAPGARKASKKTQRRKR